MCQCYCSGKIKELNRLGQKDADRLHSMTKICSLVPAVDDCFVELPGSARLLGGAGAASDVTERTNNAHRASVASCQYERPSACAILFLWDLLLHHMQFILNFTEVIGLSRCQSRL